MSSLLKLDSVTRSLGGLTAVNDLSLEVNSGEILGLIGPNGAGKSTLLNALSGIIRPAAGRIVRSGRLSHVPEGRQVFPDLTVEDNIRLGAYRGGSRDPLPMYELFPQLRALRHRRAGGLSGGEQQMVAICRSLMAKPDVLAIDELSQGLAPLVVADIARHLIEMNEQDGTAMLLVEQNAQLALSIASRAYVLENGCIRLEGRSSDLMKDPAVRAAYLGGPGKR